MPLSCYSYSYYHRNRLIAWSAAAEEALTTIPLHGDSYLLFIREVASLFDNRFCSLDKVLLVVDLEGVSTLLSTKPKRRRKMSGRWEGERGKKHAKKAWLFSSTDGTFGISMSFRATAKKAANHPVGDFYQQLCLLQPIPLSYWCRCHNLCYWGSSIC